MTTTHDPVALTALLDDIRAADDSIGRADAYLLAAEILTTRAASPSVRGHSPDVVGHYTPTTEPITRGGRTIGTRTVLTPSAGAPTNWGNKVPDPTALPRHESTVTRSRKRGASFKVTRRANVAPAITTPGDDGWCDPVTGNRVGINGTDERSLIAAANAILAMSTQTVVSPMGNVTTYDPTHRIGGHALLGRETSTPAVFGGRGYRGWADYRIPTDDRSAAWCEFHDDGADRCACAISYRAGVGPILNNGAAAGAEERLPNVPRYGVTRGDRICPMCSNPRCGGCDAILSGSSATFPATDNDGTVYDVAPTVVVELPSWSDQGYRLGHGAAMTCETIAQRREARETARENSKRASKRAAAAENARKRDAERIAASKVAADRKANLEAMLAALRTDGAWHPRDGWTVTVARSVYTVTRADQVSTHRSPAAVLMVVDA